MKVGLPQQQKKELCLATKLTNRQKCGAELENAVEKGQQTKQKEEEIKRGENKRRNGMIRNSSCSSVPTVRRMLA